MIVSVQFGVVQRQRGLVYHMRSRWFDYTETFRTASSQGDQGVVCSVPIHLFQVVQPQRTSSNLFEPLQCRESKVCIGLSHEFGVVRLYRTFSNHIFTRGSRCRAPIHYFWAVELQRTSSNFRTTLVQRKQCMYGCLT